MVLAGGSFAHTRHFILAYYYPAPRGTAVIAVRGGTHANENLGRARERKREREGERSREREEGGREKARDVVYKARGIIACGRKLHARAR